MLAAPQLRAQSTQRSEPASGDKQAATYPDLKAFESKRAETAAKAKELAASKNREDVARAQAILKSINTPVPDYIEAEIQAIATLQNSESADADRGASLKVRQHFLDDLRNLTEPKSTTKGSDSTGDTPTPPTYVSVCLGDNVVLHMAPLGKGNTTEFIAAYELTEGQYFQIDWAYLAFKREIAGKPPLGKNTADHPNRPYNVKPEKIAYILDALTYAVNCQSPKCDNATNAQWAFRLPTVAEWERACCGGRDDNCGFDLNQMKADDVMCHSKNCESGSRDVGYFQNDPHRRRNAWGLFDMQGNLWEWCITNDGKKRKILGGSFNEPVSKLKCDLESDPSEKAKTAIRVIAIRKN